MIVGPFDRYNYLDKMSGITTLFEISGGYGDKTVYDIIETHHPVEVPGVEGLLIPSGTLGRILKVLAPNIAFVYWEVNHMSLFVAMILILKLLVIFFLCYFTLRLWRLY